jgi:hypothetical protein
MNMRNVSIGEIQKNISILTQAKEPFVIIDKRKNRQVAVVQPLGGTSVVASLAGKYRDRVTPCWDLERAKEKAMEEALREKYGFSD